MASASPRDFRVGALVHLALVGDVRFHGKDRGVGLAPIGGAEPDLLQKRFAGIVERGLVVEAGHAKPA